MPETSIFAVSGPDVSFDRTVSDALLNVLGGDGSATSRVLAVRALQRCHAYDARRLHLTCRCVTSLPGGLHGEADFDPDLPDRWHC